MYIISELHFAKCISLQVREANLHYTFVLLYTYCMVKYAALRIRINGVVCDGSVLQTTFYLAIIRYELCYIPGHCTMHGLAVPQLLRPPTRADRVRPRKVGRYTGI